MEIGKKGYLIILILLVFFNTVVVVRHLQSTINLKNDLERQYQSNQTLNHRIRESIRINNLLYGFELKSINNIVNYSNGGHVLLDGQILADSYIVMFTQNHCPPCIEEALRLISNISRNDLVEPIKVLASYQNPSGYYIFLNKHAINSEDGFYSKDLDLTQINKEEVPVLVRTNSNGQIIRSCFLDKHMPEEAYLEFLEIL